MADVLDRIGDQLLAAERSLHLKAAAQRTAGSSRPRRLRALTRRPLVALVTLAGVAGAGGLALAQIIGGNVLTDQQYLYHGQHAVPETAMTADQTADLAILRRPRRATDSIPAGAVISNPNRAMAVGEDGANLRRARLAQSAGGVGAWVMPANAGLVCLAMGPLRPRESTYHGGGPICRAATAASRADHLTGAGLSYDNTVPRHQPMTAGYLQDTVAQTRTRFGNVYFGGVVPDGVHEATLTLFGGATETVRVRGNVYMARLRPTGVLPGHANLGEKPVPSSAPPTLTVTFTGPAGTITLPTDLGGARYRFAPGARA